MKALHLEPGVFATDTLTAAVAGSLRAFAAWHGTPEIILVHCDLPSLAEWLAAV